MFNQQEMYWEWERELYGLIAAPMRIYKIPQLLSAARKV